jgi:gamma-glutamyltranspeptidase
MLQAVLNVVEFGMNVQQAVEAPTLTTSSFAGSNYPQRRREPARHDPAERTGAAVIRSLLLAAPSAGRQ